MLIGRVALESLCLSLILLRQQMQNQVEMEMFLSYSGLAHHIQPSGTVAPPLPRVLQGDVSVCVRSPVSPLLVCASQIRVPAFLDLFMQSLFKPGARINQDHKHKYIHILAYAASVVETWKKVLSALASRSQYPLLWYYWGIVVTRTP